jgi:hypothetical protein
MLSKMEIEIEIEKFHCLIQYLSVYESCPL